MCDKCDGTGYITSVEFVEHFGGSYRMPVTFVCDCLADGECPKCGEPLTVDPEDDRAKPKAMYCTNCRRSWED